MPNRPFGSAARGSPQRLSESLGKELLAALPTLRIYSLSLHNREGDALWLSDGTLGPDEHSAAIEGLEQLNRDPARGCCALSLGDGRSSVLLPARSSDGLRGVGMVVVDGRAFEALGEARLVSSEVCAVLERFAASLAPAQPAAPVPPQTAAREPRDASPTRPLRVVSSVDHTQPMRRLDSADIVLFVQQLLRLRSMGRTRRYEVLLRSRHEPERNAAPQALAQTSADRRSSAALDRHVLDELLRYLGTHREIWTSEPASFSVNLGTGTLLDEDFGAYVAQRLRETGVAPEIIGFEIAQADCIAQRVETARLIAMCEQLGCYVVLDDFTLHSEAVPLLASPVVRSVKIDAKLTGAALGDRLSQALVIAISQMCKVLGSHCVAKRIETPAVRQWLTAVGIDFAQGFLLEKPLPLESLGAAPYQV